MSINLKKSVVLVVSTGKMTHSSKIQLCKFGTLTPIGETPWAFCRILQFSLLKLNTKFCLIIITTVEKYSPPSYMKSTSVLPLIHMLALPNMGGIIKWTVDKLAAADLQDL